jgi:hypothetical protein
MPTPIEQRPIHRMKEAVRSVLMVGRRLTAANRALPNYLIIGAQKCGTTSLYHELSRHPQVAPAFRKEPHFFDDAWHRGESWYRANFARARAHRITGEASPHYLFSPEAPARVRQMVPEAKLIVMLRNPVDRAWSHYHHERRRGYEALSFEAAIAAEPQRLAQGGQYHRRHHAYVHRGEYAGQLQGWLAHFPREQMLVIRSEDYRADAPAVYSQVLAFLGLPALELASRRERNVGSYRQVMPAQVRAELTAHFQPHNEALYTLLARDMHWS